MNRIRKSFLIFSAFVLVPACGILLSSESPIRIQIGTNDYDANNAHLMKRVQPFDPAKIGIERNADDTLVLFETSGKDVMEFTGHVPFTWIHIWRPWCPNDKCQDISMFDLGSNAHQDKGLFLIMLSESYDLKHIDTITMHSAFLQPICVIDAKTYGTSIKKNRQKFLEELGAGRISENLEDDFIFRRDSLIFSGEIPNLAQLDSILME
ncbi:MAG: hypothetical protein ACYC1Q_03465 [Bacteroidia bacterium]